MVTCGTAQTHCKKLGGGNFYTLKVSNFSFEVDWWRPHTHQPLSEPRFATYCNCHSISLWRASSDVILQSDVCILYSKSANAAWPSYLWLILFMQCQIHLLYQEICLLLCHSTNWQQLSSRETLSALTHSSTAVLLDANYIGTSGCDNLKPASQDVVRTSTFQQTHTGNAGLTRAPLTYPRYSLTQANKRQNCLSLGRYLHVCHDLVQEDAVHQLHEHVDPLLRADLIAWTQRTQRPHLQAEREVNFTAPRNIHRALMAFFIQLNMMVDVLLSWVFNHVK